MKNLIGGYLNKNVFKTDKLPEVNKDLFNYVNDTIQLNTNVPFSIDPIKYNSIIDNIFVTLKFNKSNHIDKVVNISKDKTSNDIYGNIENMTYKDLYERLTSNIYTNSDNLIIGIFLPRLKDEPDDKYNKRIKTNDRYIAQLKKTSPINLLIGEFDKEIKPLKEQGLIDAIKSEKYTINVEKFIPYLNNFKIINQTYNNIPYNLYRKIGNTLYDLIINDNPKKYFILDMNFQIYETKNKPFTSIPKSLVPFDTRYDINYSFALYFNKNSDVILPKLLYFNNLYENNKNKPESEQYKILNSDKYKALYNFLKLMFVNLNNEYVPTININNIFNFFIYTGYIQIIFKIFMNNRTYSEKFKKTVYPSDENCREYIIEFFKKKKITRYIKNCYNYFNILFNINLLFNKATSSKPSYSGINNQIKLINKLINDDGSNILNEIITKTIEMKKMVELIDDSLLVEYILYTFISINANKQLIPFNINILTHNIKRHHLNLIRDTHKLNIFNGLFNNGYQIFAYSPSVLADPIDPYSLKTSTCGETMILNLINYLIYDDKTNKLNYNWLPIDTMPEIIDFFKKNNTIHLTKENCLDFYKLLQRHTFIIQKLDHYNADNYRVYSQTRQINSIEKLPYIFTNDLNTAMNLNIYNSKGEHLSNMSEIQYSGYTIRPGYISIIRILNLVLGYHKIDSKYNENLVMHNINENSLKDILLTFKNPNINNILINYEFVDKFIFQNLVCEIKLTSKFGLILNYNHAYVNYNNISSDRSREVDNSLLRYDDYYTYNFNFKKNNPLSFLFVKYFTPKFYEFINNSIYDSMDVEYFEEYLDILIKYYLNVDSNNIIYIHKNITNKQNIDLIKRFLDVLIKNKINIVIHDKIFNDISLLYKKDQYITELFDYLIKNIINLKPYFFIDNIIKNYNYELIKTIYKNNPSILYQLSNTNNIIHNLKPEYNILIDDNIYSNLFELLNQNKEVFNLLINTPNHKFSYSFEYIIYKHFIAVCNSKFTQLQNSYYTFDRDLIKKEMNKYINIVPNGVNFIIMFYKMLNMYNEFSYTFFNIKINILLELLTSHKFINPTTNILHYNKLYTLLINKYNENIIEYIISNNLSQNQIKYINLIDQYNYNITTTKEIDEYIEFNKIYYNYVNELINIYNKLYTHKLNIKYYENVNELINHIKKFINTFIITKYNLLGTININPVLNLIYRLDYYFRRFNRFYTKLEKEYSTDELSKEDEEDKKYIETNKIAMSEKSLIHHIYNNIINYYYYLIKNPNIENYQSIIKNIHEIIPYLGLYDYGLNIMSTNFTKTIDILKNMKTTEGNTIFHYIAIRCKNYNFNKINRFDLDDKNVDFFIPLDSLDKYELVRKKYSLYFQRLNDYLQKFVNSSFEIFEIKNNDGWRVIDIFSTMDHLVTDDYANKYLSYKYHKNDNNNLYYNNIINFYNINVILNLLLSTYNKYLEYINKKTIENNIDDHKIILSRFNIVKYYRYYNNIPKLLNIIDSIIKNKLSSNPDIDINKNLLSKLANIDTDFNLNKYNKNDYYIINNDIDNITTYAIYKPIENISEFYLYIKLFDENKLELSQIQTELLKINYNIISNDPLQPYKDYSKLVAPKDSLFFIKQAILELIKNLGYVLDINIRNGIISPNKFSEYYNFEIKKYDIKYIEDHIEDLPNTNFFDITNIQTLENSIIIPDINESEIVIQPINHIDIDAELEFKDSDDEDDDNVIIPEQPEQAYLNKYIKYKNKYIELKKYMKNNYNM